MRGRSGRSGTPGTPQWRSQNPVVGRCPFVGTHREFVSNQLYLLIFLRLPHNSLISYAEQTHRLYVQWCDGVTKSIQTLNRNTGPPSPMAGGLTRHWQRALKSTNKCSLGSKVPIRQFAIGLRLFHDECRPMKTLTFTCRSSRDAGQVSNFSRQFIRATIRCLVRMT